MGPKICTETYNLRKHLYKKRKNLVKMDTNDFYFMKNWKLDH